MVHAVMTSLEDRVLTAMEEAAATANWECATLMGDGILTKPRDGEWPTEWGAMCRRWEGTVLARTGVRVRIQCKTLEGANADPRTPHAQRPQGA